MEPSYGSTVMLTTGSRLASHNDKAMEKCEQTGACTEAMWLSAKDLVMGIGFSVFKSTKVSLFLFALSFIFFIGWLEPIKTVMGMIYQGNDKPIKS